MFLKRRASIVTLFLELYVLITEALATKHLYMRNSRLDGYTCGSGDIVGTFDNVGNEVACIAKCAEHGCLDVFYHPSTKHCLGCYTLHSDDLLPAGKRSGSMHYKPYLGCPDSFVRYNTSCYKVTTSKMPWKSAKDHCASENAYLAIIEDTLENDFIGTWLENTVVSSNDKIFLGLTDSEDEATWRTVNGDIQTFTSWYDGEPNNGWILSGLINENCAAIDMDTSSKQWNDISCDESHFAVCEKELL